MAELIIRRAVEADLPALVALLADDEFGRRRDDPGPPLDPAYAAAFAAIDRDPAHFLAVMEEAGRLVGCAQITVLPGLSRRGSSRGQIESVRIAADRRGQGLGGRLLVWAIAECRRRGCAVVQLTTDRRRTDAHRFYQRLGFVPSHEGMKLDLARQPPAPS